MSRWTSGSSQRQAILLCALVSLWWYYLVRIDRQRERAVFGVRREGVSDAAARASGGLSRPVGTWGIVGVLTTRP
jgi:4-amino-4-deoxy-L-arabinose transferase-like glycosyltransferase